MSHGNGLPNMLQCQTWTCPHNESYDTSYFSRRIVERSLLECAFDLMWIATALFENAFTCAVVRECHLARKTLTWQAPTNWRVLISKLRAPSSGASPHPWWHCCPLLADKSSKLGCQNLRSHFSFPQTSPPLSISAAIVTQGTSCLR